MKSSDLLIKCLENDGVTRVFGVPGEETLDILESLRNSSIQFITTRHEQAAAFMAATYGRLTGLAGVVLTTLGPGATNLATGLTYATLGGIPLLVSRAFRHAEQERPGAVLLEIPEDIARENTGIAPLSRNRFPLPNPNPSLIKKASELIRSSRAQIIIIGADAKRWDIENELSEFINQTRLPFVTTQLGKGILPETNQYYLGTTALTDGERVHDALKAADTFIVIGHTIFEKSPCIPNHATQKIIHINTTPGEVSHIYQPSLEIVGDVAESLRELTSVLKNFTLNSSSFGSLVNNADNVDR